MECRIKENENGYFTIYEVKTIKSFLLGTKTIEEKMDICHLYKGEWFINGMFKSENDCIKFLDLYKEKRDKIRVNKIINV